MKQPVSTESVAETTSLRSRGRIRTKFIIASLCLAQFLAALDVTIVATALPTIASSLGATTSSYTWVGSSYALASTSSTPVWAKCSEVFGRKPILMLANAVFLAGSLIAALSQSIGMLIGGRTIQGLGAGGIMILCSIIIGDMFALRERAKYYGLMAIVWSVASGAGPLLGASSLKPSAGGGAVSHSRCRLDTSNFLSLHQLATGCCITGRLVLFAQTG